MKTKSYIRVIIVLFAFSVFFSSCSSTQLENSESLYQMFQNPSAEARPFVRWWWNGNNVEKQELLRQLDVIKAAGFGGIEVNPIENPGTPESVAPYETLTWISSEWNQLLVDVAQAAQQRGLVTDMLIGSGWPFGSERITDDESIHKVVNGSYACREGDMISEDLTSLYARLISENANEKNPPEAKYEILYLRLIPKNIADVSQIIDLTPEFNVKQSITYQVPEGEYDLAYAAIRSSYRQVYLGVKGASGLSMDHFRADLVQEYLEQLLKIAQDTGVALSEIIRALFCDSIELEGANWTAEINEKFYDVYGYSLEDYYPFVFHNAYNGYSTTTYSPEFTDKIYRVRYDFNRFITNLFNVNFPRTIKQFCEDNDVLFRYQAYGMPYHMDLLEGNMIADIPESNNWSQILYNPAYAAQCDWDQHYGWGEDAYSPTYATEWCWDQHHGYMLWNMYAASAAHLTGKRVESCEAMTNTDAVYQTSLGDIKLHDDMNFITGMTHAVVHGFNYSPLEVGFPGWVRYGTYFSEQNTWWKHVNKWTDYNARLSSVFQATQHVKRIAMFAPEGDMWSKHGLSRPFFHRKPWYCMKMWESLSQCGSGCDYITENIIIGSEIMDGKLSYGPMQYEALVLCDVRSMTISVAQKLELYVEMGGKLVILDEHPHRTLSLADAPGDTLVQACFERMMHSYPERVFQFDSPDDMNELLTWTEFIVEKADLPRDVFIENPSKNIYQNKHVGYQNDIYFFVNSHLQKAIEFTATFPIVDKIAWVWNPETGERYVYSQQDSTKQIKLAPGESLLLVFDHTGGAPIAHAENTNPTTSLNLIASWNIEFKHVNKTITHEKMNVLVDISTKEGYHDFSGEIIYKNEFIATGREVKLTLPNVNRGLSELYINGKLAGVNWYGEPSFNISALVIEGKNKIEIHHATLVTNYCFAQQVRHAPKGVVPQGIEGTIIIQ